MNWPDSAAGGDLGDGRFASATDRPTDLDALGHAVRQRVIEGFAIYPQGGRTSLEYGEPPRRPGVAIDTRSLNRVIDYPAADMTITVEAGLTLSALQAILAEYRQRLPLDPPIADRATLGGIIACNASGPRRFGTGRPRDLILGVSFVNGEGVLIKGGGRVVKNVAGYDFPRLLTGSMGTLGVIAQMTLKVRPLPEASAIAWAAFDRVEDAGEALDRLNLSDTRPIAQELLNRPAAGIVGQGLGLPEGPWVLAVGYEDNARAVAWQIDRLKTELRRPDSKIVVVEGEAALPLWSRLADFPAAAIGPVSFVANLRISSAIPFLQATPPDRWAIQAHAGNGIVRGHSLDGPGVDELAPEIDRLRARAVADRGNLILPRCPTEAKDRLRVWGEPRPDWALAGRIKKALDPAGVMNPGRFIGII